MSTVKYDIVLSGVGGQGVLSVAAIIARGAMMDGLNVKQSEVHGMAQRGGAVLSHLRISSGEIASDLIASGRADMILSMEPLECLRYLDFLAAGGVIVTSSVPVENIPNYPDIAAVLGRIEAIPVKTILLDSKNLAKEAGSIKSSNMVMVGAASGHLPVKPDSLKKAMDELFAGKGTEIVDMNLKAFALGAQV